MSRDVDDVTVIPRGHRTPLSAHSSGIAVPMMADQRTWIPRSPPGFEGRVQRLASLGGHGVVGVGGQGMGESPMHQRPQQRRHLAARQVGSGDVVERRRTAPQALHGGGHGGRGQPGSFAGVTEWLFGGTSRGTSTTALRAAPSVAESRGASPRRNTSTHGWTVWRLADHLSKALVKGVVRSRPVARRALVERSSRSARRCGSPRATAMRRRRGVTSDRGQASPTIHGRRPVEPTKLVEPGGNCGTVAAGTRLPAARISSSVRRTDPAWASGSLGP